MRKLILLFSGVLWLLASSCHDSEQDDACTGSAATFQLGQSFALCIGSTASQANQGGLSVKFNKLIEDSRCPLDVVCVRAGSATVEVVLTKASLSLTDTLSIGDNTFLVPDSITFENYHIKLQDVLPAPVSTTPTHPDEYKIKLTVTQ